MGNPLRNRDPAAYRILTVRTVRGEMWLEPSGKNARLIGGIIARYQELLGIEIYAYCVLSNHLHLLIRAPRGNADEFAENINREIARRINWKYKREGSLWARRYSEQVVLEPVSDLLEAFLYITLNPTRHGLVRNSLHWTGLNSYSHALKETDRAFTFLHYSKRNKEGVPEQTSHKLRLSPLPQFRNLTQKKRRSKLKELLEARSEEYVSKRGNKNFLGQQRIREQTPGEVPRDMSRSPRPACYSKCRHLIQEFMRERRLLLERYAIASLKFRLGELNTKFPMFTFKPPTHRAPRILPFTPITAEYLSKICA